MSRKFLIPILTAIFLAAPAFAPAAMTSLSDSALAQKIPETNALNLNTSRSNIYRQTTGKDKSKDIFYRQTGKDKSKGKVHGHHTGGSGHDRATSHQFSSDIRLKRDIVQLGRLDNGLGLYRYRYTWSDEVYVGVMAQEVAEIVPDAVMRGPDGYLRVDYARLGLRLMTWDEWTVSAAGE